ncbi:lipopolysaccharide biosynthesis protein [Tannerella sp.]|uniref:lipopolysaccharide biosynthesis protein n=1 Tax=Tannerella sp. TaxID=2382127 RepID=UPI0026DBFC7F|nr:polysaccharide biosynthesis C-terminal domain-containing protein [Tannerella sp.]MDO4704003.1 polysaccharide biosynthesis C-terminal domain-containing protein [Tannerella sp.]
MLKKILATVGTRYAIALLNLLLILIHSRVLGRDGMGVVGVIYASVNLAVIFNSVLCGNTIVYFMHRQPFRTVFWPTYAWAFVGSAIACICMALLGMLPEGYGFTVYGLSVLLSLVAANARFLLGKDLITAFNAVFIIQGGLLFFILVGLYFGLNQRDVSGYLWGLFLTNLIAWMVSLGLMVKPFFRVHHEGSVSGSWIKGVKAMFMYGLWSSADNLAEGLTTRLNYFLLQRFGGYGQVGLLDSGTKISESIWHISHGVSFIAYSQIARTSEAEWQRSLTLQLFKLTYSTLIVAMALVLCLPEWVYTDYLFTPEFAGIRKVIVALAVGIVTFGSNRILSHYFIGTGRVRVSAACSCIGLIVLLIAGALLIPAYGVTGAALSSSIAFSAMLLFSIVAFLRLTPTRPVELLPGVFRIKK